jgi:PAS domain S-box-containing protein
MAANTKSPKNKAPENQNQQTIGLLIVNTVEPWQQLQWSGVSDAARQRNVNLFCFPGGVLHSPYGFDAQRNMLYDLVNARQIDGLILWAGDLDEYVDQKELEDFCKRYHPLPIICAERTIDGIPSIHMNNYQSMREIIVHLIEEHGYRRIAFIRGPEGHLGLQERYRAYTETLADYDLPLDPNLVRFGYRENLGVDEVATWLLDEQVAAVEAVVGHNDSVALCALRALQSRGKRVPQDMAVAGFGFDDNAEIRAITPSLTTVNPLLYEMGQKTVEMLLARIDGKEVPKQVILSGRVVVRESCGCASPLIKQAAAETFKKHSIRESYEAALAMQREDILGEMMQAVGEIDEASDWTIQVLDGFVADMKGDSPGIFLRELYEVLRQVIMVEGDVAGWHGALSALRCRLLPALDNEALVRAENFWQQARLVIGEMTKRAQAYQTLRIERQTRALREIEAELITTFDVAKLMDVLAEKLPHLGIPGCYLSLYETNPDLSTSSGQNSGTKTSAGRESEMPAEWSRLMLAYNEEGRVELEPGGRHFPSSQLIPEGILPRNKLYSMVVEPLYFREEQIGFVLFAVGPQDGVVYESLRGQISSSLKGAILVQRVQERTAELVREQYAMNTFMENIPDSIYFKDLNSRITRANKAHATQFGLSDPVEEIGKTDFDFFPEEEARIKYEQEQEIIRTGQPIVAIEEHRAGGGWVLTTKIPLRNEHGEIIGTFGISRDITELKQAEEALEKAYAEVEKKIEERTAELKREVTERKQAEKTLAEERSLLRTLIDNLPNRIFVKDSEGRFLLANTACIQAAGATAPDELIGKTVFDLFPPDLAEKYHADDQQVIRSGQPLINQEEPGVDPETGAPRWLLTTKVPLRGSQDNLIGLMGITRDITDRKQSQEELRRHRDHLEELVKERTSELTTANEQLQREITERKRAEMTMTEEHNLLRTLMDNLLDYVYVKDCETRFILANDASIRAAGATTPDELIGKTDFDLFPLELAENYYADDQTVLRSGQPLINREEPSVDLETGTTRWLLTTKVPLRDSQGNITGLVGVTRDISERKRAEIELQHAKEAAEAASHAKSEFLAHMSHELRTPLNGILGYVQILKRDQKVTESQRDGLDIIERCGTHLLTLINEVLDLSKIEAQKMELHETNFLLPEFLSSITAMIRVRAQHKGLVFHYEAASDLPRAVRGDEKHLSQVLLNLLSNAVKFTEEGSVTLRVSWEVGEIGRQGDREIGRQGDREIGRWGDRELGSASPQPPIPPSLHPPISPSPHLRFEVSDTGIGIPEEKLHEVFSPFIQVGKHNRTIEGTGLGLAISRELVRLMGGELHVKSKVNEGSTFWLELDFPEVEEEIAVTGVRGKHIIGFTGEKRKILVVDDKWENRAVLVNLLLPLGFEVTEAENGYDGLQKAAEFMPDLILMDLIMPVMDGFEATRRIRQSAHLKHVKILAISASTSESQRQESIEAGCDGFIAKPVEAEELFEKVGTQLGLEWIYEEQGEVAMGEKEKMLVIPPLSELNLLYDLAEDGDFMGIQRQLDNIDQLDERYRPFVNEIRNLAKAFLDDKICKFIERYIED